MSEDEITDMRERLDNLSDMVTVRLDSQDVELDTLKTSQKTVTSNQENMAKELVSIRGSLLKIEGYVDNAIRQDQEELIIKAHEERLALAARKLKDDKVREEREAWAKWEKWYPTLTVIGILLGGLVGVPTVVSVLYWVFEFVANSFGHMTGHIPPTN